jgi:hypothetical protein
MNGFKRIICIFTAVCFLAGMEAAVSARSWVGGVPVFSFEGEGEAELKQVSPGGATVNVVSLVYDNDPAHLTVYGRMYNWFAPMRLPEGTANISDRVQGASPAGWHIPTEAEWMELINALGGESAAGRLSGCCGTIPPPCAGPVCVPWTPSPSAASGIDVLFFGTFGVVSK